MESLTGKYTHAENVIQIIYMFRFLAKRDPQICNRCGALLSSPDFRLHACDFFKLVCSRYATALFDLISLN